MSSTKRKRKERQRKLAAMTDEERKEFKLKENKRRRELRRKQLSSMSKADLDAYMKKDKARKKKTVNPTTPASGVTRLSHYRSKQSHGKALKKSLNSLPSSPRKRTSVIAGLAKRPGLKLECQMGKRTRWNPSKEVEGDIENFYLSRCFLNYAR